MKILRSILKSTPFKILLLVFVTLVFLELLSTAAVYFILDIKNNNYAHLYENDPKLKTITWTENYTPHPYFGYESPKLIKSEKILSNVGDNDFVIGILGGSVAAMFGEYSRRHLSHFEPLREVIPTFGDKNLQIVNLALGGAKQPQQFFISVYYMDKLDLIINIDGYNDAVSSHLLPFYPLEFPNLSTKFYRRTKQGGFFVSIGRMARWVYKEITFAPKAIPGLSRSSLYFVFWYNIREFLYRVVRACESAYYDNEFKAHQTKALRDIPEKEFIQKRIDIWKKYTILEDDVIRKRTDKPIFFFLQPNQYLKNSKPFSEQEKLTAVDSAHIESTNMRMVLLKTAVQDLRRTGVPIFDLTGIFSDTKDTIYKDTCCHINNLGNRIMADVIVSDIMLYQTSGATQTHHQ